MSRSIKELVNDKNYIILNVIKELKIQSNVADYYAMGAEALVDAEQLFVLNQNKDQNFDEFAYQVVNDYIEGEQQKQKVYSQLFLTLEQYLTGLNDVKMNDVINCIDLNYFYKYISSIEFKIISLFQSGFENYEIAHILDLSIYSIESIVREILIRLRQYIYKIEIN